MGSIRFLPKNADIPAESCCWNLRQPSLNDRVFGHPCVIQDIAPCGHLVFCLPMTSFGSTALANKFSHSQEKLRVWYMELIAEHGGPSPNGDTEQLLKHSGQPMKKGSYLGTGEGYWIEPQYLSNMDGRRRCLSQYSLARLNAAVSANRDKSNPLTSYRRTPSTPEAAPAMTGAWTYTGYPWGYTTAWLPPSPPLCSYNQYDNRGRAMQSSNWRSGLPTPPSSRSPPRFRMGT